MNDLFKNMGVIIKLKRSEDFNIVRETLTRIGIASYKKKTLTQSCHIYHKQGEYAIMHFKEMLLFDDKDVEISEQDYERRDTIAALLVKFCGIELMEDVGEPNLSLVKVLKASDKEDWTLVSKYTIGKK